MKLHKKFITKKNNLSFIALRNKKFIRIRKISQIIRKEVTNILQYNNFLSDFSIKEMITISKVDISYDISYAKIFVTFAQITSEKDIKNRMYILQKKSKFIRKILSKNIQLKSIPEIKFKYDNTLLESIKISNLINQIIKKQI